MRFWMFSIMVLLMGLASACKRPILCEEEPAKPDLINHFEPLSATDGRVGEEFELRNITSNLSLGENCAGTLASIAAKTRMIVEYRKQELAPFDSVFDDQFDLGAVPPDSTNVENYAFLFAEPGQYRITTIADGTEIIEERDETNNAFSDADLAAEKREGGVSVVIRENPDFDPEAAEFLAVERVKVRVK